MKPKLNCFLKKVTYDYNKNSYSLHFWTNTFKSRSYSLPSSLHTSLSKVLTTFMYFGLGKKPFICLLLLPLSVKLLV